MTVPTSLGPRREPVSESSAVSALYAAELFIVVAIVNGLLIALAPPKALDLALLYMAVT
jgi:hypothetical protein